MDEVGADELPAYLAARVLDDDPLAARPVVVALDGHGGALEDDVLRRLRRHPGPIIGRSSAPVDSPLARGLDVLISDASSDLPGWVVVDDLEAELARLGVAVAATPLAARVLLDVLRRTPWSSSVGAGGGDDLAVWQDVDAGLVAESTAYSTLLSGPEFARWLAGRGSVAHRTVDQPVRVERGDGRTTVELHRPEVHNAFDASMREALSDALAAAAAHPADGPIVLRGAGPSFCAGGDLSEFGTASDPATAHLIRTSRGPARWLADLSPRVVAQVHGACIGAGVELAAFAGRVEADPATTFGLPELAMGLIPGAGGTVSLPRRIGRQRTTWWALRGASLDAPTALAWGLADALR